MGIGDSADATREATVAQYFVRVVLHGATAADYSDLHAEMAKVGGDRTIRGDSGTVYDLPDAEYVLHNTLEVEAVRDAIVAIAAGIRSDPSVLVIEVIRSAWRLAIVPGVS